MLSLYSISAVCLRNPHAANLMKRTTDSSSVTKQGAIAGFSMLELVMVLLVSSTLSACAIPVVVETVNSYRLQSAVANTTWAIRSARFQALMAGYPFQVAFTAGTGGLKPVYQLASEPAPATVFSNVGTSVPLTGSAVVLSASTTLQFKANGVVSAATGGLSFQLTYKGRSNTITVSNYGNVKVTTP
jgi:Tfp pilus assembly protein FimT